MPLKVPEDDDGEKRPDAGNDEGTVSEIFKRFRTKKRKPQTSAEGGTGSWNTDDLAIEMSKLGLDPAGLGNFIRSLHRLAVASKVDPVALASLIKDLSALSEGRQLSVEDVRKKVRRLSDEQTDLTKKIAELNEKKTSLEDDLNKREDERNEQAESVTRVTQLTKQLKEIGISLDDLSHLATLVSAATQLGHSPSEVSELLANLDAVREKRSSEEAELEKLFDAKRTTQQKLIALENEIVEKQTLLESAADLQKLGFGPKNLEEITSMVRMIAKTRNIGEDAARQRLISDLQSYYANDQELRTRLRTTEALLREKEEKFGMLDTELRNERAVLENASKLISAGVDEQWLKKLRGIIDSYGPDLETLARELQMQKGLSASIEELAKTKKALEEEERLLRQKVVAAEDQRIKTLSLINDLIVHPSRPADAQDRRKQVSPDSIIQMGETKEFLISAVKALELIRARLPPDSPARVVLDHALLALRLEPNRKALE